MDEAKGRGRSALGNLKNATDDVKEAGEDLLDRDKP
jgi:hypothetical protein